MSFTLHRERGMEFSTSDRLPVPHFFSCKLGGAGDYPYSSKYDPDWLQPETQQRVRRQWETLCDITGFPRGFCLTHQVHGNLIRPVTASDMVLPPLAQVPADCDGLCTAEPGVPVGVFSADCVPVLFCEPEARIVAAAHCGWKGTALDMAGSAVAAIRARGGRPEKILAAIGPAISACCFQVGPEVPEAMVLLLGEADAAPTFRPQPGAEGKYLLNLKEVNRRRLLQLGVPAENIDVSPDCTMCQSGRYWSHRATQGRRGTQCNAILLPLPKGGAAL